ncbi:FAD-dependent oxidoreductase [Variovorax sp. J22P271]|uniref:NAD(P)/FAD-dependent oxidoreductase n=1 Tax=Variovorax davisae TaxID=3053515 RepID=UPI0025777775|nr:FAD-dependent oxidoreductase [Variovorax sp. J22P271]MDM0032521.1 FAD-dependent oxidoreductase [Variovorax sp. J22P271]
MNTDDDSGGRMVIVGGGQAAGAALKRLRQLGYPGQVTLVSDETNAPYERPPLSKEYLWGAEQELRWVAPGNDRPNERLAIDRTAVAGDARAKTITCSDGAVLPYDFLLLATGGLPRRLAMPGAALENVHCLRRAGDALALRQSIERCVRARLPLLVVGGSWIGLEVAAGARETGVEVVLVEQGARLCGRTLPPLAARWLQSLHASRGVDLRLETSVASLDGDVAVRSARLSDGTVLPVGAVLVGIGIAPNISLASQLGLLVRSGIVVDRHCRTSAPAIYAAGDVAEQACPWHEGAIRIETWDNANRQGEAAATHIAHMASTTAEPDGAEDSAPPWFWSDQYGTNLQVLGAPTHGDTVLASPPNESEQLFIHLRGDRVVGAIGMNRRHDMRRLRKRMAEHSLLPRAELLQAIPGLS